MKRRNKSLIIISIVMVVLALVFFITSLTISKISIIEWLTSKYAMLFYIVFGTYGLIVLSIVVGDWIKRL